ncbi:MULTISPECIES: septum formation initiator family protein [unclassified Prevotella]|uniref:FtsB family cell division protein n=1 Tax=unclassified Prevotella TaxID=2638335 RepID=UPI000684B2A3|nr:MULTISPECIES: septum formation initiator family protein [unclassified Prevotella]
MKVLTSIKAYALRIWQSDYFKYAVVCILGVLLVGFLDDNSLWSHFQNRQRIADLEEEKLKYESDYQRDQAQIKELDRNPKAIEKIARERYFMKADDEDIFVLSDDDREAKPLESNERVE